MTSDQRKFRPSCPICREATGRRDILLGKLIGPITRTYTEPSIENVLFVPDRKPLCRDHLLICPRAHVLSISEAIRSNSIDVIQAINYAKRLPTMKVGILVFEHGMAYEDPFATCIDHAHLHVCPVTEAQARAFMETAAKRTPAFVTQDVGDVSKWVAATAELLSAQRGEYAAFSFSASGFVFAAVARAKKLPSGFFRNIARQAWRLDGSEEEDSVRAHRIVATKKALMDAGREDIGSDSDVRVMAVCRELSL